MRAMSNLQYIYVILKYIVNTIYRAIKLNLQLLTKDLYSKQTKYNCMYNLNC